MNYRLSIILSAFALSPIASFAQDASVYYQGFNNYQLGDNVGTLMNSVKTNSAATDAAASAITTGGKDFCNDVGLGSNKASNSSSASTWDKGSDKNTGSVGANGGWFSGNAKGSGKWDNKETWNKGSKNNTKVSSSNIVKGKDCSTYVKSVFDNVKAQMDNDTQRLDILVGNETQRYGIDKQHQVAIKQIEAGQIQNVFGGGAKAMMGSMAE